MPFLENEQIKLRALEPEDLDILYLWENNTDLWQYGVSIAPYSRYAIKEYIQAACHDIIQARQLRLMIVMKDSNQPVGTIDLYDYEALNSRAGIGILIDPAYQGRGLGYQVLQLVQQYAFRFLSLRQLYAHIPTKNEISLKLFTKSGYLTAGCLRNWIRINDQFEDVMVVQLFS